MRAAIADTGSTLAGVSWGILGALAFVAFVAVCVVLPIWAEVRSANVWCRHCGGHGEVDTGRREHDTGGVITATCVVCDGTGKRGQR